MYECFPKHAHEIKILITQRNTGSGENEKHQYGKKYMGQEQKESPDGLIVTRTYTKLKIKAVATVDCGSIMCCDIGAIRQRHG